MKNIVPIYPVVKVYQALAAFWREFWSAYYADEPEPERDVETSDNE